jgi:peptidoglycan/LPS O-acetylase OafA/YrhL
MTIDPKAALRGSARQGGAITGRYEALDGLRGIAALSILWLHIRQAQWFSTWPPNAPLSVDFFFCLSGFVIAHAYEERLKATMGFWRFAKQRLLRLTPLSILGALLGGGVLLLHSFATHDVPAINVAAATALNVVMLPSFGLIGDKPEVFATDGPLWSLFWELLINAAFALAALRLTTPRLVSLVLVGAALTVWTSVSQRRGLDVGSLNSTFILGFCRVLFPFSCGVLIHRLPVTRSRLWPALAALLFVLLLGPGIGAIGQALAVLVAFPLIVWLGAGAQVGPRIGSACLWIGRLSYPLYAVHEPLVRVLATVMRQIRVDHSALAIALSLGVAIASGWFAMTADERLRAWLKVRLAQRARHPVQVA